MPQCHIAGDANAYSIDTQIKHNTFSLLGAQMSAAMKQQAYSGTVALSLLAFSNSWNIVTYFGHLFVTQAITSWFDYLRYFPAINFLLSKKR